MIDKLEELFTSLKFQSIIDIVNTYDFKERDYLHHLYKLKSLNNLQLYDEVEEYGQKVIQKFNFPTWLEKYTIYSELLLRCFRLGRYAEGLEALEIVTKFINEVDTKSLDEKGKKSIASYNNHLGNFNYGRGDFEKARDYYAKVESIGKEIGDMSIVESALINMGVIDLEYSNFSRGEKIFKEAIKLANDNENQQLLLIASIDLATIYEYQGRLEEASKLFQTVKSKAEKFERKLIQSYSHKHTGEIYFKQGRFEDALNELKKSLEIETEVDRPIEKTQVQFSIFMVFLVNQDRESAGKMLDEMKQNLDKIENEHTKNYFRTAEALFNKESNLLRYKQKAENQLRELIKDDNLYSPLSFLVFLNLVELLLQQIDEEEEMNVMTDSEEREIKDEIFSLFNQMKDTFSLENNPYLQIQVHYIEAYLHLIDHDIEKAKSEFVAAVEISEKYGLKVGNINQPNIDDNEFVFAASNSVPGDISNSINNIIHTEPRLKILIALNLNTKLTFAELKQLVGLTSGNLGRHCDKLVDAGYIDKRKEVVGDKFLTVYSLTPGGLMEFNNYRQFLAPFLIQK